MTLAQLRSRPTKAVMDEAGINLPDLATRLSDIEHPLVMKAQATPLAASSGTAERARSLTDRPWYKVKTSDWRGAVGNVEGQLSGELDGRLAAHKEWWWLAAAGKRQDDSPQRDFWARIEAAAFVRGKNT